MYQPSSPVWRNDTNDAHYRPSSPEINAPQTRYRPATPNSAAYRPASPLEVPKAEIRCTNARPTEVARTNPTASGFQLCIDSAHGGKFQRASLALARPSPYEAHERYRPSTPRERFEKPSADATLLEHLLYDLQQLQVREAPVAQLPRWTWPERWRGQLDGTAFLAAAFFLETQRFVLFERQLHRKPAQLKLNVSMLSTLLEVHLQPKHAETRRSICEALAEKVPEAYNCDASGERIKPHKAYRESSVYMQFPLPVIHRQRMRLRPLFAEFSCPNDGA